MRITYPLIGILIYTALLNSILASEIISNSKNLTHTVNKTTHLRTFITNGETYQLLSSSGANIALKQQTGRVFRTSQITPKMAYNTRTGNRALVTGQIIVQLQPDITAQDIADTYGLGIISDFTHLNLAFLTINSGQELLQMVQLINQDTRIESAEIDILEHKATAN
jgi:hypothetical protein